jgi:hypothetical protein
MQRLKVLSIAPGWTAKRLTATKYLCYNIYCVEYWDGSIGYIDRRYVRIFS